jgi:hypothetical protein
MLVGAARRAPRTNITFGKIFRVVKPDQHVQ